MKGGSVNRRLAPRGLSRTSLTTTRRRKSEVPIFKASLSVGSLKNSNSKLNETTKKELIGKIFLSIKRKLVISLIPQALIKPIEDKLKEVKDIALRDMQTQNELDEFWTSWNSFCDFALHTGSFESYEVFISETVTQLRSAQELLGDARSNMKNSGPQINRIINEVNKDINELCTALSRVRSFRDEHFEQLIRDLKVVKQKINTSQFRIQMSKAITNSQKARDYLKFNVMFEDTLSKAAKSLEQYIPKEIPITINSDPEIIENHSLPVRKVVRKQKQLKTLIIDDDDDEDYDKIISELLLQKKNLEKINSQLNTKLENAEGLKEERLRCLEELKQSLPKDQKINNKKLTTEGNSKKSMDKFAELRERIRYLKTEIGAQQARGDMACYLRYKDHLTMQIRSKEQEQVQLEESLKKMDSVEASVNAGNERNEHMEIMLYNKFLFDEIKSLKATKARMEKEIEELERAREADYESESIPIAYQKSCLEGASFKQLLEQADEDISKVRSKAQKVRSKAVVSEESIEWVNEMREQCGERLKVLQSLRSSRNLREALNELREELRDSVQRGLDDRTSAAVEGASRSVERLRKEVEKADAARASVGDLLPVADDLARIYVATAAAQADVDEISRLLEDLGAN